MATPRTDRREGRPSWNLLADRDRYLVAVFWATQIVESQFGGNKRATRHAVAMTFAAIERGKLIGSVDNLAVISREEGKLAFRHKLLSRKQFEERPEANEIKKRADDIRRTANWAMESDSYDWLQAITAAFAVSFYEHDRETALILARVNCTAVDDLAFFERSLRPFIIGRFDPAKRVVFSLPEFTPNFS
jgi:hypothetical protein